MMLESTFYAMTSSFRAILSVAENMGRLRLMFGQFLNNFALVRILKWLYWKARYLLGMFVTFSFTINISKKYI